MGRLTMRVLCFVLAFAVLCTYVESAEVMELDDGGVEKYGGGEKEEAWPPAVTPEQSAANMKKWEKEGKVKWDGTHLHNEVGIHDVQPELQRMTSEEEEAKERQAELGDNEKTNENDA